LIIKSLSLEKMNSPTGHVFNDTAQRLQNLLRTLQQSEDRLRLVIDTIPPMSGAPRADGSVDSQSTLA